MVLCGKYTTNAFIYFTPLVGILKSFGRLELFYANNWVFLRMIHDFLYLLIYLFLWPLQIAKPASSDS